MIPVGVAGFRFVDIQVNHPFRSLVSKEALKEIQASSSIGRASVSKTEGWGFDALLACQQRMSIHRC